MKFILTKIGAASLVSLGLALGGCDDGAGDEFIEETSFAMSLEANEDGSDPSALDPLEGSPSLLHGCGRATIEERLIQRFDENHDGTLDRTEREFAREEVGAPPLTRLRATEPGPKKTASSIDFDEPEEREAPQSLRHERMKILAKTYDEDFDGELDASERQNLREALEARCTRRLAQLTANFDANDDGKLGASEWKAAAVDLHERFRAQHEKVVDAFDSDRSGELEQSEVNRARRAFSDLLASQRLEEARQFDEDESGSLDRSELSAFLAASRARIRGDFFEGSEGSPRN